MEIIKYVDFSNNVYTIRETSFHYDPMQPKYSSSGTYSGGEEVKKEIPSALFNQVKSLAATIVSNKSLHQEKRRMLTALLYITKEGENTKYIIGRSSDQKALEGVLKKIKSSEE